MDRIPLAAPTPAASDHPALAAPVIQALPEPCARCGRDADAEIGTLWLCLDCYHIAGSTCAGLGVGAASPEPTC